MNRKFNLTVDIDSDEDFRSYIKQKIDDQVNYPRQRSALAESDCRLADTEGGLPTLKAGAFDLG